MKTDYKIIGFDADDTLWVNEPYYRETEIEFCGLLVEFAATETVSRELYQTEMQNIQLYGFGAKGFMLSMIETAQRISDNQVPQATIAKIIALGKDLLNRPVVLLNGVLEVLDALHNQGKTLIVATKGDLLDQERKLAKSNIAQYFHHIEIMSDKKESDYRKLLAHLDIQPEDFLMIGNSIKSDILPILNIGGSGIHIPYHTTWQHEQSEKIAVNNKFHEIDHISEILSILK